MRADDGEESASNVPESPKDAEKSNEGIGKGENSKPGSWMSGCAGCSHGEGIGKEKAGEGGRELRQKGIARRGRGSIELERRPLPSTREEG